MNDTDRKDPWVDPAFEQTVRDTAYFLWEQDGRPFGREQEYWFAALERCLRRRESDKALNASLETREGRQFDDNIDDLGRPVGDKKHQPLDQPK